MKKKAGESKDIVKNILLKKEELMPFYNNKILSISKAYLFFLPIHRCALRADAGTVRVSIFQCESDAFAQNRQHRQLRVHVQYQLLPIHIRLFYSCFIFFADLIVSYLAVSASFVGDSILPGPSWVKK